MSNLIWSSIETIFWVWCLIIGSYQLLNITSFCHHQIYYDNIITNLMTSLMLTNSYKSTILNHNSCYALALLFPHPLLVIWPKSVDFCLIWLDNPLLILHSPFLHSPFLVLQAKFKHCFWCRIDSSGFFFFTMAFILCFLTTFRIVWVDTRLLIMLLRFLATSTTFSTFLALIWLMIALSSAAVSFFVLC
jgi:hypothetical protein